MKYSTVIFDLSEVLIRGIIGVEKTLFPLIKTSEDAILGAFCGTRLLKLCAGNTTEEEYLADIIQEKAWDVSATVLKRHIRDNFNHTIEGMVSLVSELSPHYHLVLHSDNAREWVRYIRKQHKFLDVFNEQFYSFELGLNKRQSGIFEKVLAIMNKSPEECLFVDDNFLNVVNARRCGIDGIYFVGKKTLMGTLKQKGILGRTELSIL